MRNKPGIILHIIFLDKFIDPFIHFLESNFEDFERHLFFLFGDVAKYPIKKRSNIIFSTEAEITVKTYIELSMLMNRAEKIIIHGLWLNRVVQLLTLQPWLLDKCHWVIWGGDLYCYKLAKQDKAWRRKEIFRRFVIKRIGHLITYIEGDVNLARKWYGACGEYHECLMYPSNVYKGQDVIKKTCSTVFIQIGNSADTSGEHFEMLDILKPYKDEDISIYAPLSYGSKEYATKVTVAGNKIFGSKFIAINDFMPFDNYVKYLGAIDIALFNHKRQQAMGNIITLLGLGKKVYLREDITSWQTFSGLGIKLFNIKYVDLKSMKDEEILLNKKNIKQYFSDSLLLNQWKKILE